MLPSMTDTPHQDRLAGLRRERRRDRWTGRVRFVTAYHPHLAARICDEILRGRALPDICRDPGMCHPDTFLRWVSERPDC